MDEDEVERADEMVAVPDANEQENGPAVRRLDDWRADRLVELVDEYGSPLYVLDVDRVRENYRRFAEALPEAEVHYAAKANSSPAILQTMRDLGTNVECASPGELQRVLNAGFEADEINYSAVNPPGEELDALVEWAEDLDGLTVTAGAVDTLERLADRGYDGRIALRVNPGIGAGHHDRVATGADRQFGVPLAKAAEILDCDCSDFDVVGLHAHIGSGILDRDLPRYEQALSRVTDTARDIEGVEFVDLGGGLGVPYHPEEDPLDLEAAAEAIRSAMDGVDAQLKLEPGRFLAADAGVLLTTVNTVKRSPAGTVAGVDAGLHTFMRTAMFDAYHPVRNVSGTDRERDSVSVGGPVCSSADTLCENREMATPERGDVLAIGNAGAYGYELSARFHSRPRPAEVAVDGGDVWISRRRGSIDDVIGIDQYRE